MIPAGQMGAPVIEYMRHSATTGTADTVAAGALKPSITFTMERLEARARKIAGVTVVNDEDFRDFPPFASYVSTELSRILIDAENDQIINGDGTGENLTGMLHTTGVLTRPVGTDTHLDAMQKAFTDLRTGAAKCVPTVVVMNPSTWSSLLLSKDSYNRYLIAPDPTKDAAGTLWGVPVLQTTTIAAGTALAFNGEQFAQAGVKDGLTVQTDYGTAGFEHNTTSLRVEERVALAVTRPAAGIIVTGLV